MPAALELWVVTLNAGGGRRDATPSPAEAGAGLGAALSRLGGAPDLVGLQEASRLWRGRVPECLATSLAGALGAARGARYRVFFFPILDSRRHPALSPDPSPKLGGGARGGAESVRFQIGNAILVRRDAGLRLAPWPWVTQEPNPLTPLRQAQGRLFPAREGGSASSPLSAPERGPRRGSPSPFPLPPSPLDLPLPPPRLYSTGTRDTEPRHLALVALSLPRVQPLYFMTTHLATLAGERGPGADPGRARQASDLRRLQCQALREVVGELRAAEAASSRRGGALWPPGGAGGAVVLAGDFNAEPGSPELDLLSATDSGALRPVGQPRWRDAAVAAAGGEALWTHVSDRVHIDHILVDDPAGRLHLLDYLIWNNSEVEGMTDHYPVVARFACASGEAGG